MTPASIWAVAGLVVAGLEMLAPGIFLLWVGLAMLGTAALAEWLALGWHGQLESFVVLAALLIGAAALRLRRHAAVDAVNAPAAGLIGQTCRVVDFRGDEGRVSLGDGTWYARLVPGANTGPALAGQALRIVGLDGTTLLVTKA